MANNNLITVDVLKNVLGSCKDSLEKDGFLTKDVEPGHNDVPLVFISGELPSSKEYVNGSIEYISKTLTFKAYTKIKLQGNSTLSYPKKNYTIKMYRDESHTYPLNIVFKNWGNSNVLTLKADYNDILHARNVVCSKLWGRVVASRHDYKSLPDGLKNSPNNGAIDGFPVKVYIDGNYVGLYSLVTNKNEKLFGMDKNNPNHAVLQAEVNDDGEDSPIQNNPCNFASPWEGIDGQYFSLEVGDTSNISQIKSSFDNIYCGINEAMEDGTLEGLTAACDVQSLIDYYIFQDVILGTDGLAKNMLLATYDMEKWYLSAYDLDSTFGLTWQGEILDEDYNALLSNYGNGFSPYMNIYSRLLMTVYNHYYDRYVERYAELRKSVLSYSSIMSEFESYVGIYGDDGYIKDTVQYPNIPSVTNNNLDYIRTFVKNRLDILDEYYGVNA